MREKGKKYYRIREAVISAGAAITAWWILKRWKSIRSRTGTGDAGYGIIGWRQSRTGMRSPWKCILFRIRSSGKFLWAAVGFCVTMEFSWKGDQMGACEPER